MAQCAICDALLVGRQLRFCSKQCSNRHHRHTEIGDERRRKDKANERARLKAEPRFKCRVCGQAFGSVAPTAKYCSEGCHAKAMRLRNEKPKQLHLRLEQPTIQAALRAGDPQALVAFLRRVTIQESNCWIWQGRREKNGYPEITFGAGKRRLLHRLIATSQHGELGHRPVHHKCARRACVNPDHLQVVHPHENAAEMLERNYYQHRIAVLEEALAQAAPGHPLLFLTRSVVA